MTQLSMRQLFFISLFFITFLGSTLAIEVPMAWATDANCTAQAKFQANEGAGQGVVTAVMETIIGLLENTSETLYEEVINDSEYLATRNAVLLLAITIYGVMIIFNLANFKPGEVFGIIFKIAVIMMLTGPTGWEFFNQFIGDFFMGTMIEMVEIFMGTTTGAVTSGYVGATGINDRLTAPLSVFNWPMARIISTQFFVTILGVLSIPTYGIICALLLLWAGFNLLMALFSALFTYIKSIVGLWFLFALAPIFFLTLLFRRTQNLFSGWLNMVVSFTLQPILLFAFLSFFITITTTSLGELMKVNWCWMTVEGLADGSVTEINWWRPMVVWDNVSKAWVELKGGAIWGLAGLLDKDSNPIQGIVFPVDPTDIMFFLLSSYVAWQYAAFVPQLANSLAQGGLRISVNAEAARNYFSSKGWTPQQIGASGLQSVNNWRR